MFRTGMSLVAGPGGRGARGGTGPVGFARGRACAALGVAPGGLSMRRFFQFPVRNGVLRHLEVFDSASNQIIGVTTAIFVHPCRDSPGSSPGIRILARFHHELDANPTETLKPTAQRNQSAGLFRVSVQATHDHAPASMRSTARVDPTVPKENRPSARKALLMSEQLSRLVGGVNWPGRPDPSR